MNIKLQKQKRNFDKSFFGIVIFFLVLGLIIIADASFPLAARDFQDKFYFVKKQFYPSVVGIILLVITSFVRPSFWKKAANILFFGNILLMILVFVPGFGIKLQGASRWLNFGFTTLQPSEFLKLTISIYLAKVASKDMRVAAYFFPVVLSIILVMSQPDLGTALVIAGISMVQVFVSGMNIVPIVFSGILGSIVGWFFIITSDYRRARLDTFLSQTASPLSGSYHIKQILLALGSGGLFGVGFGQSRQKYLFLPETATDSIFAIIAEEVGFIGSLFIIVLFLFLIFRGFKIALGAPDTFSKVLSVGLISWIGIQVFLNIGSMVAIIPLTGVPLPFVSYGGSSLVSILVGCGILLSISKDVKKEKSGR